jgi:hypothetical protein
MKILVMIDERAHKRLDDIEARLLTFEANLTQNTELTRTIATNTTELVALVKGVKVGRKFILWVSPIVVAIAAVIAYFKGQ